jgi:hypothetical protein
LTLTEFLLEFQERIERMTFILRDFGESVHRERPFPLKTKTLKKNSLSDVVAHTSNPSYLEDRD